VKNGEKAKKWTEVSSADYADFADGFKAAESHPRHPCNPRFNSLWHSTGMPKPPTIQNNAGREIGVEMTSSADAFCYHPRDSETFMDRFKASGHRGWTVLHQDFDRIVVRRNDGKHQSCLTYRISAPLVLGRKVLSDNSLRQRNREAPRSTNSRGGAWRGKMEHQKCSNPESVLSCPDLPQRFDALTDPLHSCPALSRRERRPWPLASSSHCPLPTTDCPLPTAHSPLHTPHSTLPAPCRPPLPI
jgi:hypothetical protein